MSVATQDTAVRTGRVARTFIYLVLVLFALFYLLPFFVMLTNSLKPLSEITGGNMMSLPQEWTLEPWRSAWSTAQIGVEPTGLQPYFLNSLRMVVSAVAISTVLGALNGYLLTKWRFRGDTILFGLMLFACFIPFQIVLIPMARVLGLIAVVSVIWQFTNIWNDFLFGASFADLDSMPMTVALNDLVNSSTGVKEYNVHFAGAILAALPTLLVYIVAGRYFVRGLMAGSVKG